MPVGARRTELGEEGMQGKLHGGVDCGAGLEDNKESSRQRWKRKEHV